MLDGFIITHVRCRQNVSLLNCLLMTRNNTVGPFIKSSLTVHETCVRKGRLQNMLFFFRCLQCRRNYITFKVRCSSNKYRLNFQHNKTLLNDLQMKMEAEMEYELHLVNLICLLDIAQIKYVPKCITYQLAHMESAYCLTLSELNMGERLRNVLECGKMKLPILLVAESIIKIAQIF